MTNRFNHDLTDRGLSEAMPGSTDSAAARRVRPARGRPAGFGAVAALLVAGAFPALLIGCGKEEAPVVVDPGPPPPPPAPPAPRVTPISELMTRLDIDPRVRLPEELAPPDDPSRIAVLQFFDGFVRGDATALTDVLSEPDRLELERLQSSGAWEPTIQQITRCDVRCGDTRDGKVALAVFHVGRNFEAQLWTYEVAPAPEFTAEPTPPNIVDRLSGDDWIAAWYAVLDEERRKAEEPDERIVIKSTNLDENKDETGSAEGTGLPRRGPGGGNPIGRRPVGEPIDPPSFKPG